MSRDNYTDIVIYSRQQEMFDNARSDTFFMAQDVNKNNNVIKQYSSFSNVQSFLDWYQSVPETERHYYELISPNQPFYEYYDLDLRTSQYANEDLFYWFEETRRDFLRNNTHVSLKTNGLFNPNWIITTASTDDKLSLHIVNTNVIFNQHDLFKQYYNNFQSFVHSFVSKDHPFVKAIDFCVCSRNRCMRLVRSSKLGQVRPLVFWSDYYKSQSEKDPSISQSIITNAINDSRITEKIVDNNIFNFTLSIKKSTKNVTHVIKENKENCELLSLLSKERADEYDSWLKVGMALKNCGYTIDTWKAWSKQSIKYDEDHCNSTWDSIKVRTDSPITMGTIHYWAKMDSPERYMQYVIDHTKVDIDFPFTPNITINQRYITTDLYQKYLTQFDVIALRSNMNTGKTHAMTRDFFRNYKRVIVVYHRVSLNKAIWEKFNDFGFELYSDIKEPVISTNSHPRVICQLDSIHRIRGGSDLLILDEIESTHEHLCGSKKLTKTKECFSTLKNYIKNTPKIIACDATLKDETCNILFRDKHVVKIENDYKSFQHINANFSHDENLIVDKLFSLLDSGKNVVIPCSYKSACDKLFLLITEKYPNLKVLKINSENKFNNVNEWLEYNVVIYTPTIVCGISFDHVHFHALVGFFGRLSVSSESCAQMLFRVRNLIDGTMWIYTDKREKNSHRPLLDQNLTKYITNLINVGHSHLKSEGLNVDNYSMRAVKDRYFFLYRFYLKKRNVSHMYIGEYLANVLQTHGINVKYIKNDLHDEECLKIKELLADSTERVKINNIQDVIDAEIINQTDYVALKESKRELDRPQILSMKRYDLLDAFDKPHDFNIDFDWAKTNIKYVTAYRCFKQFRNMTLDQAIKLSQQIFTEKYNLNLFDSYNGEYSSETDGNLLTQTETDVTDNEHDRFGTTLRSQREQQRKERRMKKKKNVKATIHGSIHYDKKYYKLMHCFGLLKAAGFESVGDLFKVELDWKALHEYAKKHEEEIRTLFDVREMEWNDTLDANEKKSLMKWINSKLESCLGICIKRTWDRICYELDYKFDLLGIREI